MYVDGNFLIRNNLKDSEAEPDILEFECNIKHLLLCPGKARLFVAILEDNRIGFVSTAKGFKLEGTVTLNVLDSCSIVSVRGSEDRVYLFCSSPQIVEIENVFLASRLDSQTLEERYRNGQVVKAYKFALKGEAHFTDFYPLSKDSFLLTGRELMLSWWQISHPSSKSSVMLSNFLKPLMRQDPKSHNHTHHPILLEQTRMLNETDREISKIVALSNGYALLEDSIHGRILQVHLESGLIVKILKGYRNVTASHRNNNWLLWTGNRGMLQEFPQNPLLTTTITLFSEEIIETGSFCGDFLILFNSDTNLLRILQ